VVHLQSATWFHCQLEHTLPLQLHPRPQQFAKEVTLRIAQNLLFRISYPPGKNGFSKPWTQSHNTYTSFVKIIKMT
ncbi:hypothetical protein SFRURICE_003299, partial [Spodoptera frugiperda]